MNRNFHIPCNCSDVLFQYILHQQQRLTRRMLATWPRRGYSLIHLRCGAGDLLNCLWECGFDVSGYEADPKLRLQAEKIQPPCVDVGGGTLEQLPFDDDAFDYVVFSLSGANDSAALKEAWRIAKHGILLLGWNVFSLQRLGRILPGLQAKNFPKLPTGYWWQSWRQLIALQPSSRYTLRTTLILPSACWGKNRYTAVNGLISPLPIGAFAALRLDFNPRPASPTLPLRFLEQFHAPKAAMQQSAAQSAHMAKKQSLQIPQPPSMPYENFTKSRFVASLVARSMAQ